ncbi:unnamed protein product, partial [Polarella glacialis]
LIAAEVEEFDGLAPAVAQELDSGLSASEELMPEAAVATAKEEEVQQKKARNYLAGLRPAVGGTGYEFRSGCKTAFPEIVALEGESDLEASYRVACERRRRGVVDFGDGSSVCSAQTAVDLWGQGLLALQRCRNLRRYGDSSTAAEASPASEAATTATITTATTASPTTTATTTTATTPTTTTTSTTSTTPTTPTTPTTTTTTTTATPTTTTAEITTAVMEALELVLRLNLAQALLKLKQWEHANIHCEQALELDTQNCKALWRKAKAVWGLRCPGNARDALSRLLEVEPGNPAARAMLTEIQVEEEKKRAKRVGPGAAAAKKPPRSQEEEPNKLQEQETPTTGATGAGTDAAAAEVACREELEDCEQLEDCEVDNYRLSSWPCCRRRIKQL